MGEPVKPPDPFGSDCLDCYPAGEAPEILYCVFKDIIICPGFTVPNPPNNFIFELHQTGPCGWGCGPPDYDWYIGYAASPQSGLDCFHKDGWTAFFALPTPPVKCLLSFTNEAHCPGPYYGEGTAHLWSLTDPIPEYLCEDMGFHPGESNLSHKTPTIANMADYRIANRNDKTNCLFRVDTTLIPPP